MHERIQMLAVLHEWSCLETRLQSIQAGETILWLDRVPPVVRQILRRYVDKDKLMAVGGVAPL